MSAPFFYIADFNPSQKEIVLDEEASRHIVQVLRMKTGEQLNLANGKGTLLICEIVEAHKKHCTVSINSKEQIPNPNRKITIAISLLKNSNRFEWFLEKATEIGVHEIIPLICERTEKEKFRYDRMHAICISAMLQSQQCWLPLLHMPVGFEDLVIWKFEDAQKLIAHCVEEDKQLLNHQLISKSSDHLIAIGPEGDFTKEEIELAIRHGFIPVSLGETRLRTETAGVAATALLQLVG